MFAGEDAYVTTLTEWATISRRAFAPEQIIERWHSDDGPADIEFMLVASTIAWPTQTCATTSSTSRSSRTSTESSATVGTSFAVW